MKKQTLRLITVLFLVASGTGCSQQAQHTTMLEGAITAVNEEKSFIYIDGYPVIVDDVSSYQVGQQAKAELIDTTVQKKWRPQDMIVTEIAVTDS